jgi:hypothetical protein
MTYEDLRELHDRRPFNPFTLHVSDGHPYDIVTAEYLAIHPSHTMALVFHATGRGHTFIALDSIARVSHVDAPLGAGTQS